MTLDRNELKELANCRSAVMLLPDTLKALLAELEAAEQKRADAEKSAKYLYENLCAKYQAANERVRELTQQVEVSVSERATRYQDGECYFCHELTNSIHGNPSLWPLYFCHADDPGRVKPHHVGCVSQRLSKLSVMETALRNVRRDIVAHRVRGGGFPILTDKTADAVIELLAEKALSD